MRQTCRRPSDIRSESISMAEETQATQQSTFDPETFRTTLMSELKDEFSKMLGGHVKELKKEMAKVQTTAKPAETASSGTEETVPASTTGTATQKAEENKANLELKRMREQLDQLTQKATAAEKAKLEAERVSAIKDAMSGIQFKDDSASRFFFKSISTDIERDEDGSLVAKGADGNYLPVTDYVKQQAELLPGLIAPKGLGGSGAVAGKKTASTGLTLEDIKPGMTKEQKDAIWAQIRQAQQGTA